MNTDELKAASGATQQNVFYWRSQGYIAAEGGGGQGNPLEWSEATAAHVRRMVAFVAAGCSPALAHELASVGEVVYVTDVGEVRVSGGVR